ncbi:hypothetical protein IWQ62_006725, partial [Dispira parvispora]
MTTPGNLPISEISLNANAAERCKSTLSENASVVKARNGSPSKKLTLFRSIITNEPQQRNPWNRDSAVQI